MSHVEEEVDHESYNAPDIDVGRDCEPQYNAENCKECVNNCGNDGLGRSGQV